MANTANIPEIVAKPERVSESVWEAVPLQDRAAVLPIAGTMVMRGMDQDDALIVGYSLLRHRRLLAHPMGRLALHAMSITYDERLGDAVPRSYQLTSAWAALLAVLDEDISEIDPVRQAFLIGAWETGGTCVACGEPVALEDRAKGSIEVHEECLPVMKQIGQAFRAATLSLRPVKKTS